MKSKGIFAAGVACVLCVALMVGALVYSSGAAGSAQFTPPPFDITAQSGTPTVDEQLGWTHIAKEGMEFSASVCGKPVLQNGRMSVYFTNPAENTVWLRLRVLDANGNMLGQSGLIRPGEYVQTVGLDAAVSDGTAIKLKIMAYEQQTYYSAGAVTMNTTLSVK